MRTASQIIAIASSLSIPLVAYADLVRSTLRVDVRDERGQPIQSNVQITPAQGGDPLAINRVGDVYVVEGISDGTWLIEVEGSTPERVKTAGRQVAGAVFVVAAPPAGKKKKRSSWKPPRFTPSVETPSCYSDDGLVVEVIGFSRGRLAAGSLDVRAGGKLVCAGTIAGGSGSLRLKEGTYQISSRFVGGGADAATIQVKVGSKPAPLVLKSR